MSILDNKIIDLMKIENIATLSMAEQKNLAILIIAKNELSRLSKKDCDSFTTRILDYLNQNVISFSELDSLFTEYFEEKNPMKKNIIFKKIKPIEPLAVYLSEIAVIFNKVSKTHEITIKGFVYNLILYWFEAERRRSNYLSAISDIQFQPHIDELVKNGATVTVFDPEAIDNVRSILGDQINYAQNQYEALENADALLIATEWSVFRNPDFEKMESILSKKIIFDGRNLFDLQKMVDLGYYYNSVGRKLIAI